jgi:hypothetical protein
MSFGQTHLKRRSLSDLAGLAERAHAVLPDVVQLPRMAMYSFSFASSSLLELGLVDDVRLETHLLGHLVDVVEVVSFPHLQPVPAPRTRTFAVLRSRSTSVMRARSSVSVTVPVEPPAEAGLTDQSLSLLASHQPVQFETLSA